MLPVLRSMVEPGSSWSKSMFRSENGFPDSMTYCVPVVHRRNDTALPPKTSANSIRADAERRIRVHPDPGDGPARGLPVACNERRQAPQTSPLIGVTLGEHAGDQGEEVVHQT